MRASFHKEVWPLAKQFAITGFVYTAMELIVVELFDGVHVGRGEAAGVDFLGETPATVIAAIESAIPDIEAGIDCHSLMKLLPRGGARNAIDCALWDLECKRSNRRAWDLGETPVSNVETVYTIGLDTPDAMAREADAVKMHRQLKVKLNIEEPIARLRAIRDVRPDALIVVDANQGWTMALLDRILPDLVSIGVAMIEQPLPRGGDEELKGFSSPIRLCADESCLSSAELDHASARYQIINIKLDKAGGLTEALALARGARERGMALMVGNMIGTSLAMAPAFLIAQLCEFIDLDGPLLLKRDRVCGMNYRNGWVEAPAAQLWG